MELPSFPLLSIFLLLLFMLLTKWKRLRTQNLSSKLPPGPWKLPLIGNMHHLLGLPHRSLRNLAKKYGPLMHLQLGEVSAIVVSSPKVAKEVMKTHDLIFLNRPMILAANIVSYGCKNIAFAPYGDYWRQLRKVCILELLSSKRVQSFSSLREEVVSNLIQIISSMDGSIINFSEKIFSSTNDITSHAVFGNNFKDKHTFMSLAQELVQLAGGFDVADLFPSLKFLHIISGTKPKLEKIHQKLDQMLEDIIREHKDDRRTKTKKDEYEEDLLDVILRLQESTELAVPITGDHIKAVLIDVFVAGSETSSTAIEWAMSEMLKNPAVMEKAQAELRRVFTGNKKIKETDFHQLSYLKSIIKETLRLHSPAPLLSRECMEDCMIDGYEIPVNTKVIINAWAISRDSEYWRDPEKFEPERFHGVSPDYKGANFEYIPFGAGRRICPGILFGVANIELQLAKLLYHFDWKLSNGVKPEELDMTETFGAVVRRRNDLYLIAIPSIRIMRRLAVEILSE